MSGKNVVFFFLFFFFFCFNKYISVILDFVVYSIKFVTSAVGISPPSIVCKAIHFTKDEERDYMLLSVAT